MLPTLLLAAAITAEPDSPNDVIEAAVIDLASVPPAERTCIRYLSRWPQPASRSDSLASALSFWLNSLSWSPKPIPLRPVQEGALYRIDLRDYGWTAEAWEALAKADPYFAVTTVTGGKVVRGWLDPTTEAALRKETQSKAVLRADWFLARTSLDGEKGFFRGFYSTFLALPKTEKELEAQLGAKAELAVAKSSAFNRLFLLQGGAVLESTVAQHNRGLELLPTLVGGRHRFLWRSLDTDADAADASILDKLAGTHRVAGKEFIFSLPNGLHGYYATDGKGNQVREVPTNIAQDKGHPHDGIVYVGFKCVRCHGPNGGINGFDDVIRRLIVARNAGVAVIGKGDGHDDDLKRKLDAYYGSDLALDTKLHRESYTAVLESVCGLAPDENTRNYLGWVEGYLYGRVNLEAARAESGFGEETETYLKLTSPSPLVALLAGETVSRELFEANSGRLLTAKVYPWEEPHAGKSEPVPRPFVVPRGAVVLDVPPGYPAGSVRYRHAGQEHLVYRDGRRFVLVRGEWQRAGR